MSAPDFRARSMWPHLTMSEGRAPRDSSGDQAGQHRCRPAPQVQHRHRSVMTLMNVLEKAPTAGNRTAPCCRKAWKPSPCCWHRSPRISATNSGSSWASRARSSTRSGQGRRSRHGAGQPDPGGTGQRQAARPDRSAGQRQPKRWRPPRAATENVLRFTEGLTIRKVIVVPGKLVNIVAN